MTQDSKLPEGWQMVEFGDLVRNVREAERDPLAAGLERYVGLEHIEPENLHIKEWGLIEEGTSFTQKFVKGQVLFGKRRAYQRKVAVAEFDGVCSGDILVFEPKDDRLLPGLLPFIVQSKGFFTNALRTSSGSLSPRTRLVRANENFSAWLRGEHSMPFGPNNEHVPVRLIDFDDPRNNRYAVTTQFVVKTGQERRLDLVLLVNGIPLVVGEAKTPTRPAVSWVDGAVQIQNDYERSVPEVFAQRLFLRHRGQDLPLRRYPDASGAMGPLA